VYNDWADQSLKLKEIGKMSRSNEEYLADNFEKLCRFCLKLSENTNNFENLVQNKLHSAFINQFGLQVKVSKILSKLDKWEEKCSYNFSTRK
jgi:tRNA U54 and U55 pseudouridine synthase Pus10